MTPPASTGRRRKQLQVAVEGVRRRRPPVHHRRGDPALRSLLAEPYTDVRDAHDRLRDLLAAFESRDDRRAVFLSVYVRMTGTVADHIEQGTFADPDWVGAYLVAFANLYRRAAYAYETDALDSVPDPWQLAFEAADRGDSLVIQDALLGVNAHINYDLALTLADVGVEPNRDRKYADHKLVTDIIREIIDESQAALAARDAPGLESVDDSLGRFDEWLWVFTIDECRDSAWRTAVALTSRFGVRRTLAQWINDVTSTGAAHLLLSSKTSSRLHDSLRSMERTDGQ